MATITLQGCGSSMRLGQGAFQPLGSAFDSARKKSSDLASSLRKLRSQTDAASSFVNVNTAQSSVKKAESRESNNKSALTVAYKKLDEFIYGAGFVDSNVASQITKVRKAFYEVYSWMKPECYKNWREKARDYLWDKACKIGNAIKKVACAIGKWIKEHWVELLIGLACIIVGAIITVLTGGAGTGFWAAFVGGLVKAAIAAAIEGAISATVTFAGCMISGMSLEDSFKASLKAFGDGFASGFMTGGITFLGHAVGAAGKSYKFYQFMQKGAKITKYAKEGFDKFEMAGKLANLINPDSPVSKLYNSITSSSWYKYSQKAVSYTSTFFGAASKSAVIKDGSHIQNGEKMANVRYTNGTGNHAVYETDKNGKATTEMFYKDSQRDRLHAADERGIGGGYEVYKMKDGKWQFDSFRSDTYDINKIPEKLRKKAEDVILLGDNKYYKDPNESLVNINIEGIQIPQINVTSIRMPTIPAIAIPTF